jgi:hypothetical protein
VGLQVDEGGDFEGLDDDAAGTGEVGVEQRIDRQLAYGGPVSTE